MTSQKNTLKWIAAAYVMLVLVVVVLDITALVLPGCKWCGDAASLLKVFVEAVLFPAALIGFFMAVEQFRRTLPKPNLNLSWQPEPGAPTQEIVLGKPTSASGTELAPLAILNKGNAVSRWYLVEIRLPSSLVATNDLGLTGPMRPPHGLVDNWRARLSGEGGECFCIFTSDGQAAAYPHCPLELANVAFQLNAKHDYSARYRIEYSIFSEGAERNDGILTVRISSDAVSQDRCLTILPNQETKLGGSLQ